MATISGRVIQFEGRQDSLAGTPRANAIDRWIFVFMAAWFILIVLVGFVPDAIMKVQMVQAGQRPPFPLILHMHSVAMGAFLLLLLAQTTMMATGHNQLHKQIGVAAFVLVPLLIVIGVVLAPTMYYQTWDALQTAPVAARGQLQQLLSRKENVLLLQLSRGLLHSVPSRWH